MARGAGEVTAWARCVRGLEWVDDILQLLSPIVTGVLILGLASFAWLAMDRKPPFEVLSVEPASAAPGESVVLVARVWRDMDRDCSCVMRRALWDGQGVRHDDATDYVFSADAIRAMHLQSPGVLRLSYRVPDNAAPGLAALESDLTYFCNPAHRIFPISTRVRMPFTITAR